MWLFCHLDLLPSFHQASQILNLPGEIKTILISETKLIIPFKKMYSKMMSRYNWNENNRNNEKKKFSSPQYPCLLFPWPCDWKSGQHFKSWSPWKAQKPLKIKINIYRLCHNGFLVNRKTCLLFYPHTEIVVINYSTFGKCFRDKKLSAKNHHQFAANRT